VVDFLEDKTFFLAQARTEASKKPLDQDSQEINSQFSSSAIYPVAGALLGTCIGGPVGLLAGVKIGGLAAIGGSVFGRKTFLTGHS
jgi:hypothetical protein